MASIQPDLHKFFKNKKRAFNQNKLKKDFISKEIAIADEEIQKPVCRNLDSSFSKACEDTPTSAPKLLSTKASRKRKWHQIDDTEKNTNLGIKKFFPVEKPELQVNELPDQQGSEMPEKTTIPKSPELKKKSEAEQMKSQLGKCSNIHELRERLVKFRKCEDKLSDFRKNKNTSSLKSPSKAISKLEHFKSIDIEVPLSPTKSPMKTPTKMVRTPIKSIRTPKKQYCHEKYAHLVAEDTTLAIPYKFEVMKEAFRAVDTIVSLMHNRQEIITFSKLKPAVQEMLRKTFSEKQLAQLKAIFPLAYFFRQEKLNGSHYGGLASDYHLTIGANLKYKKTAAKNLFGTPTNSDKPVFRKMDSVVLVDRRKIFHEALLSIIKSHHEEFLKTLDPPIELKGREVKNWHPEFPLEELEEPEPAVLPQPPSSEGCKSAKELFAKASSLFSINNRMKNALENVATKISETEQTPAVEKQPAHTTPQVTAALKGISMSLLEKIRAREAARATREMTRSSEQTMELQMHERLPEIARIIRNYFIAEKKAALAWEVVSAKVAGSYRSMMAASDVDAHLDLLIKTVPGWCTVHKVRSGSFVKIDKNQELKNVLDTLQNAIKKL